VRILRRKIIHRALILGFSLGLSTVASAVDFTAIETLAEQEDMSAQETDKLFEWIQKAANQEVIAAQRRLGWLYDTGSGVQQDDTNAVKWYRKAADKGDAESQFNLGIAYKLGNGISKDNDKALEWYTKAADQEYSFAQNALGEM